MKGYIYIIQNSINDKVYIGKTYDSIEKRWKQHLKSLSRIEYEHRPLYSAMLKYGAENFNIKEIEYVENCEEREKYWILFYNSYNNGYNATLGGDGRPFIDEKPIIELFNSGKSVTEIGEITSHDRRSISKILKNNDIEISVCGNIHGETRNWKARRISQYTVDGEYLRNFNSLTEAAQWLIDNGITTIKIKSIVSTISKSARGIENRTKSYGFIWKFEE